MKKGNGLLSGIYYKIMAAYYRRRLGKTGKKIYKTLKSMCDDLDTGEVLKMSDDIIAPHTSGIMPGVSDLLKDDAFEPDIEITGDIMDDYFGKSKSRQFPDMYEGLPDIELSDNSEVDPSLYDFESGELSIYHFKDKGSRYKYREKKKYRQLLCGEEMIFDKCDADEILENYKSSSIVPFTFKNKSGGLFIPEEVLTVKLNENEKMMAIICHSEKFCHFPDDKYEIICQCVALVSKTLLGYFGETKEFKDYRELLGELKSFAKMSKQQQDYVVERAARPEFTGEDPLKNFKVPISGKENLKVLYNLSRHNYSPTMQMRIDDWFEQLEHAHSSEIRVGLLNQLSYVLNIDNEVKKVQTRKSYDEIMRILDKYIFGMEKVKQKVAEYLIYMQHVGKSDMAILVVGSPGVGKTSICEAIAEVCEKELAFVSCSCQGALAFGGCVRMYSGAEPNKISKAFYTHQSSDIVLLLDELDKLAANDREGNPFDALTELLGPNHRYNDVYFDSDFYIDLSDTLVVCTANDITKIPDYIIDRFGNNIFYIDDYSADFKVQIAKNYSIPKLLKQAKVSPSEIQFTDEALHLIAENYCNDFGARLMESNVKDLIRKAITGWSMGRDPKPLIIDTDYVMCHLDKTNGPNKRSIGF